MVVKRSAQELELRKIAKDKRLSVVCFQDVFLALMTDWKVELAEIQRATGVPMTTLWEWAVTGKTPMLDGNILALSQYFGCSISYLAFGIGEDPVKPEAPEVDQAALNKAAREKDEEKSKKKKEANKSRKAA